MPLAKLAGNAFRQLFEIQLIKFIISPQRICSEFRRGLIRKVPNPKFACSLFLGRAGYLLRRPHTTLAAAGEAKLISIDANFEDLMFISSPGRNTSVTALDLAVLLSAAVKTLFKIKIYARPGMFEPKPSHEFASLAKFAKLPFSFTKG